jgi:hypothetical protein
MEVMKKEAIKAVIKVMQGESEGWRSKQCTEKEAIKAVIKVIQGGLVGWRSKHSAAETYVRQCCLFLCKHSTPEVIVTSNEKYYVEVCIV